MEPRSCTATTASRTTTPRWGLGPGRAAGGEHPARHGLRQPAEPARMAVPAGDAADRRGGRGLQGRRAAPGRTEVDARSEEHTSELQSLMRISYAVFCLKKQKTSIHKWHSTNTTLKKK